MDNKFCQNHFRNANTIQYEYISYSRLKSSLPAIFRKNTAHFQGLWHYSLMYDSRTMYFSLKDHSTKIFRGFAQSYSKCCLHPHIAHSLSKFRHNASSKCKIQQNSELNPNAHAIFFAAHPKSHLLHPYTLHFRKFYFASSLHHKHQEALQRSKFSVRPPPPAYNNRSASQNIYLL